MGRGKIRQNIHTRVLVSISASDTCLLLAATPLSLSGAGTVYSGILGFNVLHVNMTRPFAVQGLLTIPSNGNS
jgi:hypothetical protein